MTYVNALLHAGGLVPQCQTCQQSHLSCSHCVPPVSAEPCTKCGSLWDAKDPVVEGWITQANAKLVSRQSSQRVTVYHIGCSNRCGLCRFDPLLVKFRCNTCSAKQGIFRLGSLLSCRSCTGRLTYQGKEEWGLHFALNSVAVHWCWVSAHLYEEQIFIGVSAGLQA